MLKYFEENTYNLTNEEVEYADVIANGLRMRNGKVNKITSKAIREALRQRYGWKIGDVRFRKIINAIRNSKNGPCIIGTSRGYYTSTDPTEIYTYTKESLRKRADEISKAADALERKAARL